MPEAVTALEGARFEGLAEVADAGLQGMITLRGDLSSQEIKRAVTQASGVDMPAQREAKLGERGGLLWMAADELMLLCPYDEAREMVERLSSGLEGTHSLVVDVSDARVRVVIEGAGAREVLGKLMPVDFSRTAFTPGHIRRSRLAQVPAAVWCTNEDRFELMAFRSVAEYVFDALSTAARQGTEVGLY